MNKPEPRSSILPDGYGEFLRGMKQRIQQAQVKAVLAVNRELITLYWQIGRDILDRQERVGWGAKIVDRLATDLHHEFPDVKGFSRTNLLYMRSFAAAWPDEAIVQQVVGQLPWGHNVRLLDSVKDAQERRWYAEQAIAHAWSRNVLAMQIETGLYRRQGKAQTNFAQTLPTPQSDLAQQLLKDPYNFDFLTLSAEAHEKDVEAALMEHIRKFLLELGVGFSFVGSQYPLEVGGEDFRIDLLFYHLKLRCFVVIDLKTRAFKPEDAGKINFYLSAVDDLLRHPDDKPSIGIILCKGKNQIVAEYALRDMSKPLGISEFHYLEQLPDNLKGTLPTVEELEAELCREGGGPESPTSPAE
jgi:predicted nuclease of restriction endonuclease-like (RecB) superfamily